MTQMVGGNSMSDFPSPHSDWIADRLDRLRGGDATARDELIAFAVERFERLAHSMLRGQFGRVGRWVDSDDVLQNATLRLWKALASFVPESPRHFHRLAARLVRHELLDLARHYYGPLGAGAHHESPPPDCADGGQTPVADWFDRMLGDSLRPKQHNVRAYVHSIAQALPEGELEVVDLIFYQGLTQLQAASVIGVDVRTVQRRWQNARRKLGKSLTDCE
jgi:RNA polymerase sigma factor (sigma-70 family)